VIRLLTGGRIVLQQQGERRRHGGWLQGRFVVRLLPFLVGQALASPGESEAAASAGTEIVIDFREPPQRTAESERAKELYDQGLLGVEIAVRLGCTRSWVSKLLQDWQAAHGEALVDGRQRRRTLVRKLATPTLPEELAEQAKALWDQGLADVQIAVQLNCSPPTAKVAVEHWHRARGLEPPNAADRRSALLARMEAMYEQQHSLRAIAQAVGMCSRSVTLLLRAHYASQGRALPDGRARRWLKPLDGGAASSSRTES
jgi:transposase